MATGLVSGGLLLTAVNPTSSTADVTDSLKNVHLEIRNDTPLRCRFFQTYPRGLGNVVPTEILPGASKDFFSYHQTKDKFGEKLLPKLTYSSQGGCVPWGAGEIDTLVSVQNHLLGAPDCTVSVTGRSIWSTRSLSELETVTETLGFYRLSDGRTGWSEVSCHRGGDSENKRFTVTYKAHSLAGRMSVGNRDQLQCIDAPGGSDANGLRLKSWRCNRSAAQAFEFRPDLSLVKKRGYSEIQLNGKCLTVDPNNPTNGTSVTLWPCGGDTSGWGRLLPEQKWYVTNSASLDAGSNEPTQLRIYDKCLDVQDGVSNGHHLILWDCHGGTNQQFYPNIPPPAPAQCAAATARQFGVTAERKRKPVPCLADVNVLYRPQGAIITWKDRPGYNYQHRVAKADSVGGGRWRGIGPQSHLRVTDRPAVHLIRAVDAKCGCTGPITRVSIRRQR